MARAKKPTAATVAETTEAADAARVVTETSNLIVRAATGRMITAEQSEKVQPTINALWKAGGPTRRPDLEGSRCRSTRVWGRRQTQE